MFCSIQKSNKIAFVHKIFTKEPTNTIQEAKQFQLPTDDFMINCVIFDCKMCIMSDFTKTIGKQQSALSFELENQA